MCCGSRAIDGQSSQSEPRKSNPTTRRLVIGSVLAIISLAGLGVGIVGALVGHVDVLNVISVDAAKVMVDAGITCAVYVVSMAVGGVIGQVFGCIVTSCKKEATTTEEASENS